MSCEEKYLAIDLKGVDKHYPQKTIDSILTYGDWISQDLQQIVAGWGVSNTLGFGVYDLTKIIRIYAPKPGTGQITSVKGAFKSMKVANVGLFQINESINSSRVYTSLQTAQYLLGLKPHKISAIEIISVPGVDETKIRLALSKIFDDEIVIKSRVQLNAALYKMLNAEHLAVYLIFTLILIIALFNIVGSIIMMILHKKDDLKTLYSIGTTKQEIQNIFFIQGGLMTIIGGLIGLFLGAIIIGLQLCFDLLMITPSLAYPVVLKGSNFTIAFSTILILGLIASRLASWNLKKLQFTDQAN